MPKYIENAIKQAFTSHKTVDGEFVIWNNKANDWLIKHYPIYTEGNEDINIGIGIIFFRWNIQRWTVR